MILHLSKFKLVSLAALGLFGLGGCGSEAGSSTPISELPASGSVGDSDQELTAVGVVTGHFKNGHVSFDPMQPLNSGTPGLSPQGFGGFTLSKISFDTLPGDGVGVSGIPGGCSATQYCALVTVQNNTGRAMESLFTEITEYFNVTPFGAPVSWAGSPFTRSGAYRSVFVHGTSGVLEAADIGNLAAGATSAPIPFKFEIGGATSFDFHVTEYATFTRSIFGGASYNNVPSANACVGGTVVTDADDAEVAVDLTFPFTLFDKTYDKAVIGSNGYMLFFSTGAAQPTLGTGNNNTAIAPAYQRPGLYPFWDDLAFDAGDGAVCIRTTGATPNRTFAVTWSNAKICNNQNPPTIPKTFAPERVTYSVIITELTDNFRFLYTLPSAPGITPLSRGGSATIMITDINGGAVQSYVYGYNTPSVPPASAAAYPYALNVSQFNQNP